MPPMLLLLCTVVAAMANGPFAPPAIPSGMDLLYDDRVPLLANGEPVITLGIATGEREVVIRGSAALRLEFYQGDTLKHATVPAGQAVEVRIRRARAAARDYYVDLDGVGNPTPARVAQALVAWRQRGLADTVALEEGSLLGMAGRIVDNRTVRMVVPAHSAGAAAQQAQRLGKRFAVHAQVKERLAERPWAELSVRTPAGSLGVATSYVRFSVEGGTVQVANVEYGRGYGWHGRANRGYRGDVYAVVDPNGSLAAVNALGAETLLQGVVPAEIFASSPTEALKAQAVAARNTLLAKLGRRHITEPFHLCGEQHCQVYAGVDKESPRTNEAVRATAGQVLFYRGKVVDAVYSSNCGGHTEDNDVAWGDAPNPALRGRPDFDMSSPNGALRPFVAGLSSTNMDAYVRTQPPSYCGRVAHRRPDKFRWQKTLKAAELQAMVQRAYPALGALRDIEPLGRGPGGRLMGLRLVGSKKTAVVNRELPIRQLFGNLNSAAFTLERQRDGRGALQAVTFTGGGWGHGVGLCQLGAIGRAEAGQTFRQILEHYYNGASVERIY